MLTIHMHRVWVHTCTAHSTKNNVMGYQTNCMEYECITVELWMESKYVSAGKCSVNTEKCCLEAEEGDRAGTASGKRCTWGNGWLSWVNCWRNDLLNTSLCDNYVCKPKKFERIWDPSSDFSLLGAFALVPLPSLCLSFPRSFNNFLFVLWRVGREKNPQQTTQKADILQAGGRGWDWICRFYDVSFRYSNIRLLAHIAHAPSLDFFPI